MVISIHHATRATAATMDKHHKLRRPAGSSIHACNICGKEGHQAAQCTNGTVNWASKFGPAWTSDLDAVSKEPDYKDIAAQARAFAAKRKADEEKAKRKAEGLDVDEDSDKEDGPDGEGKAAKDGKKDAGDGDGGEDEEGGKKRGRDDDASDKGDEGEKVAKEAKKEAPAPVSGWKVYYDQQGRAYYHNAEKGLTQWTPPTA